MDTERNNTVREVTRWLRVGVLALTTFGPIISSIVARVREQAREQAQTLQELKEHPYSQEVLKRGGELVAQGNKATQSLVEQGNKATQVLAQQGGVLVERGSKTTQALLERGTAVTHDLAERGGKLSQDLTERGSKLSQDLLERGTKVTQEVTKRGRATTQDLTERGNKAAQSLSEQSTTFWLTFGFGLAAAAIATYLLIRNRLQQQSEVQPFQIPLNGHQNGTATNGTSALNHSASTETSPTPAIVLTEQPETSTHPADSKVFGLVNTKRYYPVEMPLDQLRQSKDAKLDIVYFASEEEARLQGFTAAE